MALYWDYFKELNCYKNGKVKMGTQTHINGVSQTGSGGGYKIGQLGLGLFGKGRQTESFIPASLCRHIQIELKGKGLYDMVKKPKEPEEKRGKSDKAVFEPADSSWEGLCAGYFSRCAQGGP